MGNQRLSTHEEQLKVVGLLSCNEKGLVTVTLKPYGGKSRSSLTRSLPCTVDSLRHFRHVSEQKTIKGASQALSNECLGCSATWFYYMDPFNWADSIWTSTRLIISSILFVSSVTLLIVFVKVCLCFKKCC